MSHKVIVWSDMQDPESWDIMDSGPDYGVARFEDEKSAQLVADMMNRMQATITQLREEAVDRQRDYAGNIQNLLKRLHTDPSNRVEQVRMTNADGMSELLQIVSIHGGLRGLVVTVAGRDTQHG